MTAAPRAGPVRVEAAGPGDVGPARTAAGTPSIAVLMVTWNRKQLISDVLGALSRQTFPMSRVDVVVVDNASTDGTLEFLTQRWRPDRIVHNAARAAHEPEFRAAEETPGAECGAGNLAGLRSLTIVRNQNNFGGCGGFNTGFAYAAQELDRADRPAADRPDFAWLVDDDIDLPPDALQRLVEVAQSDPQIGLVGSRTVDLNDRETTIETTIYFDYRRGQMGDEPEPDHPKAAAHREWIARVGGTKGKRGFSGTREVDVVTAASLLARWSGVKKVGFWDYRYFIYCDDADWCLRFAKAGYRVVLNLDAVVYHTPWHHKLTPARGYYAQRNMLWLLQKLLPAGEIRRVTLRRLAGALREGLYATLHRRLFHGEIFRRTAADVISTRWGKLNNDGPAFEDVVSGLDRIGALAPGKRIAVACCWPHAPAYADDLRRGVTHWLAQHGRAGDTPEWIYLVRNDLEDPAADQADPVSGEATPRRVVYSRRWRSKLRRQFELLRRPPAAIIVFDQVNDFPLLRCPWNVHVDRRQPGKAQIERDGVMPKLRYGVRWLKTAFASVAYAARVGPYVSRGKYG